MDKSFGELKKRISTTNEAGLVAILLEKLIDNFNGCISAIEAKDHQRVMELNDNSRGILSELTVQFSGVDEISSTLREINLFTNRMITEGEINEDASPFEININVLTPMLEGFRELEIKETPKTIAGLTYGKNDIGEHTLKEGKDFKG